MVTARTASSEAGRVRKIASRTGMHLFLILASLVAIAPVFIMVSGSLKPITELFVNSWGLPQEFTLNNYERLSCEGNTVSLQPYQAVVCEVFR